MSSELEKRRIEEYETQLFSFNSRAVSATVERIIREKIEMCCEKLNHSLQKMYHSNENYNKDLVELYHSFLQQHIRNLKKIVQKLMTIPDNVLLDEDARQINSYSQEEMDKTKEHLKSLQIRVKQATILQRALKEELDQLREFKQHEDEMEVVHTLFKNNFIHDDTSVNILQCIHDSETIEKILKHSTNSDVDCNIYSVKPNNFHTKEFNLNLFTNN